MTATRVGTLRIGPLPIVRVFDISGLRGAYDLRGAYETYPSAEEATPHAPSHGRLAHWPNPSS